MNPTTEGGRGQRASRHVSCRPGHLNVTVSRSIHARADILTGGACSGACSPPQGLRQHPRLVLAALVRQGGTEHVGNGSRIRRHLLSRRLEKAEALGSGWGCTRRRR